MEDDINLRWKDKWTTPDELLMRQRLTNTKSMEEIQLAVDSDDPRVIRWVSKNQALSEEQFRQVLSKSIHEYDCARLVTNPSFPTTLLHEVAINSSSALVRGAIESHPNVREETKVICILRGTMSFPEFLSTRPASWPEYP